MGEAQAKEDLEGMPDGAEAWESLLASAEQRREAAHSGTKRLQQQLPHARLEIVEGTHLSTPLEPRAVTRLLDWIGSAAGTGV